MIFNCFKEFGQGEPIVMVRQAIIIVSVIVLIADVARAQEELDRSWNVQAFDLAPGSDSLLTIESPRISEKLSISTGLFLNYQNSPVSVYSCKSGTGRPGEPECAVDESSSLSRLVDNHIQTDFWITIGLIRQLRISLALPLIYQAGQGLVRADGDDIQNLGADSAVGLGDLRLHLTWSAPFGIGRGAKNGFGLALSAVTTFPIGNLIHSDKFFGDSMLTVHPQVIGEYRYTNLQVSFRVGYRWRETSQLYTTELGDHLTFGLGVGYRFGIGDSGYAIKPMLEIFGSNEFSSLTTLETDMGLQIYFPYGLSMKIGGGAGLISAPSVPKFRIFGGLSWERRYEDTDQDGIYNNKDACPDNPEDSDDFEDSDGCPDPDNDDDGILDESDQCPNDPEDMDDFENEDGCPDRDNDQDGILDIDDNCPNDPENINDFEDQDGCPDELPVPVSEPVEEEYVTDIEDPPHILFILNSTTFVNDPAARETIQYVVDTLISSNQSLRIRIDGHADSRGTREHNLELSNERAELVRELLVDRGVDNEKITVRFFGDQQPLMANLTDRNRELNRRVEIHIIVDR